MTANSFLFILALAYGFFTAGALAIWKYSRRRTHHMVIGLFVGTLIVAAIFAFVGGKFTKG